ncbi:hypothetical protein [Shimazuella kribbensis]|uniref:hypothetical protein n=1 Tax=Shimazuella kribbensis TaxID=139808 RepID=UPI0003FCD7FB|nr:hypothetical protein [Shimazuella kribbensis]
MVKLKVIQFGHNCYIVLYRVISLVLNQMDINHFETWIFADVPLDEEMDTKKASNIRCPFC